MRPHGKILARLGNQEARRDDFTGVSTFPAEDCTRAREQVSRGLDGDAGQTPQERESADEHLRACPSCRSWQQQAVFLQRMVRSARLEPPDDLAGSVVTSLGRARRRTASWVLAVRVSLVGLAMLGLAVAVPALLWGQDDEIEIHASHEIGSTEVALYAGLLAAALWPRRARGILAVLGAASVLLVVTAGSDIASGYTTASHEADHLIAVAGALLVWALARLVPESVPPFLLPASALDQSETPARDNGRRSEPAERGSAPWIRRVG